VRLIPALLAAAACTRAVPDESTTDDTTARSDVPTDAAAARARLEALHYDLEVAGYCSLVDAEVGAGFRRQAEALAERAGLDRAGLDALRGRAWQAAHAEWQNRGLGGYRGWCRNEGRAAAERFLSEPP